MSSKNIYLLILIIAIAVLGVGYILHQNDKSDVQSSVQDSYSEASGEATLSQNNLGVVVINNQGSSNEGHTPRGFQGQGTGLFVGDNLNPQFPNGDGVQTYLTFDLSTIPAGEINSATLRSNSVHIQGSPFEDLGVLQVEAVRYEQFSSALWNLESNGIVCILDMLADGAFECDVTLAISQALDNGYSSAQLRLRFEKAGDSDGTSDLVQFYNTNSNTNEAGIFKLEVDVSGSAMQKGESGGDSFASRDIFFSASDGYQLSGTYSIPNIEGSVPAIILSHQFNSDRHDFDLFIPRLLNEGYAVLAYDTRGFGESANGDADINNFPKDVEGALSYLKEQEEVDASRVGIIGASVGANVAFVSSGSIGEIRAAVLLSPSDTGVRGVLMGSEIPNFSPTRIFVASDEREKRDSDAIFLKSAKPKEQKVYPGFGHGIDILRSDEAQNDIISFLERMLIPL